MASIVSIWNQALSHIGNQAEIASDVEISAEANACRLQWPTARNLTLRAFRWNFAKKIIALSDLGNPFDSWTFRYQYPTDCLYARYIVNASGRNATPIPFEVASDGASGRVVLCDLDGASLAYTFRNEDPGAYEDQFVDALTWLMASRLAFAITQSKKVRDDAYTIYQQTILAAWASGLNEGEPDVPQESAAIRARA